MVTAAGSRAVAQSSPCDPSPAFLQAPALTGPQTISVRVNGALGGVVLAGRFTLLIPPGAFRDTARITIRVPDPKTVRCDLSISPPSANGFATPVLLVMNCFGATISDPNLLSTLWFDPAQACWLPVPGTSVDLRTLSLRTPLLHFSSYGATQGKAGW